MCVLGNRSKMSVLKCGPPATMSIDHWGLWLVACISVVLSMRYGNNHMWKRKPCVYVEQGLLGNRSTNFSEKAYWTRPSSRLCTASHHVNRLPGFMDKFRVQGNFSRLLEQLTIAMPRRNKVVWYMEEKQKFLSCWLKITWALCPHWLTSAFWNNGNWHSHSALLLDGSSDRATILAHWNGFNK